MSNETASSQNRRHRLRFVRLTAILVMLVGLAATRPHRLRAEPWMADAPAVQAGPLDDPDAPRGWQPPMQELSAVAMLDAAPPMEPPALPAGVEQPMANVAPPMNCRRCWLDCLELSFVARGYYLNDQRIQWSGLEATFGAEAALDAKAKQRCGEWDIGLDSEFYLNEPFNRNILSDTAERRSYAPRFEVDTFEISRLAVSVGRGDFSATIGKMDTPFGRTYFPLYTNSKIDAPFIRTEAIGWRETGVLLHYKPNCLVLDVAGTNGCEDMDTNSSKAIVSRIGLESDVAAVGFSIKYQDGIGSEQEKQFNNLAGVDAMVRCGRWRLSGEAIYEEYGFRRPSYDPDNMPWGRSLYYRDLNYRFGEPITGVGYYVDLGYEGECWITSLNFGEFYPKHIGNVQHDRTQRRGIFKVAYRVAQPLQVYTAVMIENGGYIAQEGRPREGNVLLAGLQLTL